MVFNTSDTRNEMQPVTQITEALPHVIVTNPADPTDTIKVSQREYNTLGRNSQVADVTDNEQNITYNGILASNMTPLKSKVIDSNASSSVNDNNNLN